MWWLESKKYLLILFIGIINVMSISAQDHEYAERVKDISRIKGVTLGLHSKDFDFDYGDMIKEISDLGGEWISIQPSFFQLDRYATTFLLSPSDTSYWEQLERTLQQWRRV